MKSEEYTKAKRSLRMSVIALVLAIVMTISLCLAWFFISKQIPFPDLSIKVVGSTFSMDLNEIEINDVKHDINEFSGLLPGADFKCLIKLRRAPGVVGDVKIKVVFTGIAGDTFIGAVDGLEHNMTELFFVEQLRKVGTVIESIPGTQKNFSNKLPDNIGGKVMLTDQLMMAANADIVELLFNIRFFYGAVGIANIPPTIAEKVFNIGGILMDDVKK